jgi:hypothetical protein
LPPEEPRFNQATEQIISTTDVSLTEMPPGEITPGEVIISQE